VPQLLCSVCGHSSRSKMATVYWGLTTQGIRSAWKQRFCGTCFPNVYEAFRTMRDHPDQCPECHCDLELEETVTYWATVYIPGHDRYDTSLDVCLDDREKVMHELRRGAIALENRQAGEGGPLPQPSVYDPWAALDDLALDPS